jgi:hypothetical protein
VFFPKKPYTLAGFEPVQCPLRHDQRDQTLCEKAQFGPKLAQNGA